MPHANAIRGICAELFDKLKINYFSITRLYPDGSCSDLFSDAEWMTNYIEKAYSFVEVEGFFSLYENRNDFFLWRVNDLFGKNPSISAMYDDLKAFKYTHGITLVQEYPEYKENYHFSSSQQEDGSEIFLLTNIDLLKNFCFYIKEKIFSHRDLRAAFLTRHRFEIDKINQLPNEHIDNNLSFDIDFSKLYMNDSTYLTKREFEVLRYVIRNRSSKEIGKILAISPRTVETIIKKIRFKTDCHNARDLMDYALKHRMLFKQLL